MKIVFLDRDGTVNVRRYCPEDHTKHYVLKWEDFEWMPGAKEACAKLLKHEYKIHVVSNQTGIGEGLASFQDIDDVFTLMCDEIMEEAFSHGYRIINYYILGPCQRITYDYCPHTKEDDCVCRKPRPGLLYKAMALKDWKQKDCWMVGDAVSDMKAGWNAGIRKLIKLPSLEDNDSSLYSQLYDYDKASRNFHRNDASGLLIDNLPHAVDFILTWDANHK